MRKLLTALLLFAPAAAGLAQDRELPNILWFTAEDMSPALGCYGDDYAHTPNIDKLAGESVRYTKAFATAPVCSPARSTLITGVYATSMGTQRLRSQFPIPKNVVGFPKYLRELGYYTTNNLKTDYNCEQHQRLIDESWDEVSDTAHWRGKKDGQPFFHIFNDMDSHQSRSMVWPYDDFIEKIQKQLPKDLHHDPDKAPIPPYWPDTEITRREQARFYDCVSVMDKHLGAMLAQLEEDGLADNTIVFFYSDHGSGMPRHKRNLQDTGLHVPLIIRFPEKWKHLAPAAAGETVDRLVSFVDFAPTLLSLLEVDIPKHMMGTAFLGEQAGEPRKYVFGARDRVDEAADLCRSVRDKRWLYIRNYMPHISYNQPCAWPGQGDIRKEIHALADAGKIAKDTPAWTYAGPRKVREELYDTDVDPLCLNNLVKDVAHIETLVKLRKEQTVWSAQTGDAGFLPEVEAAKLAAEKPLLRYPKKERLSTALRQASRLAGLGPLHQEKMRVALKHEEPSVRYWGAVALHALNKLDADSKEALNAALADDSAAVRIEAAAAVAKHGEIGSSLEVLTKELASEDLIAALYASRAIELMGPKKAKAAIPAMQTASARAKEGMGENINPLIPGESDKYMFLGFSVDSFLAKVEKE